MRLAHPINYFLVPKVKLSNIDIGESPELINFMKESMLKCFGNIFVDYEALIMSRKIDLIENNSFQFHLRYGPTYNKPDVITEKVAPILKITPSEYVKSNLNISNTDLLIIKAYLMDKWSYRTIEKEILKIDSQARGGGFVAKSIINSYGIEGSDKGTVTHENIENVISNNNGIRKNTLIKLKEFIKDSY